MKHGPLTSILLGLLVVLPSLSYAAVRHVPAQYSTIQGAVNAASPGDTVLVAPGTYLENVYVPKKVALLSESGPEVTTIDGQGLAPVVLVEWNVDHASVEGFRITHGYDQGFYLAAGIDIEVQVPS